MKSYSIIRTLRSLLPAVVLLAGAILPAPAAVVGYWRFEGSTSAEYLSDSSGNGYTLSNTGTAISLSAPASGFWSNVSEPGVATLSNAQSAVLTTNVTKLSVANNAAFHTNVMTVEALVNITDIASGATIATQGINSDGGAWGLAVTSSGSGLGTNRLIFQYQTDSSKTSLVTINSGISLSANTSYYLGAAYDLTQGLFNFYIQDLSAGTALQTISLNVATGSLYNTSLALNIGGYASFSKFSGTIDEVRISSTMLGASELLAAAAVPEPGSTLMLGTGLFVTLILRRKKTIS